MRIHNKIDCKNLKNSPNHFKYNKTLNLNFSENKNNNIRKNLSNNFNKLAVERTLTKIFRN